MNRRTSRAYESSEGANSSSVRMPPRGGGTPAPAVTRLVADCPMAPPHVSAAAAHLARSGADLMRIPVPRARARGRVLSSERAAAGESGNGQSRGCCSNRRLTCATSRQQQPSLSGRDAEMRGGLTHRPRGERRCSLRERQVPSAPTRATHCTGAGRNPHRYPTTQIKTRSRRMDDCHCQAAPGPALPPRSGMRGTRRGRSRREATPGAARCNSPKSVIRGCGGGCGQPAPMHFARWAEPAPVALCTLTCSG
jgi:hypothetical protein